MTLRCSSKPPTSRSRSRRTVAVDGGPDHVRARAGRPPGLGRCRHASPGARRSVDRDRGAVAPGRTGVSDRPQVLAEAGRRPEVVVVEERDPLARASSMPRFRARATPWLVSWRRTRSRGSCDGGEPRRRLVAGAVVDHEHLEVDVGLIEHRGQSTQRGVANGSNVGRTTLTSGMTDSSRSGQTGHYEGSRQRPRGQTTDSPQESTEATGKLESWTSPTDRSGRGSAPRSGLGRDPDAQPLAAARPGALVGSRPAGRRPRGGRSSTRARADETPATARGDRGRARAGACATTLRPASRTPAIGASTRRGESGSRSSTTTTSGPRTSSARSSTAAPPPAPTTPIRAS